MIYKLGDNSVQTAGDDFFIAPSASVMGRVFLEKHVSVWFGAVIRGDVEDIKIGENTILAGQVGIAGSSIIGNNVKIGGQAGISGHLRVGNNVEIGGGSGVIKDIPDNVKVMGYPAKSIREFLKDNR